MNRFLVMWRTRERIFLMSYVFLMVWRKRALNVEEKLRKKKVNSDLERDILLEEIGWRQNSRALWLREGAKRMKFLHCVAKSNRRNNSFESLLVNDSVFSDQTEIREHIVQFYYRLFTEQFSWQSKLNGLAFDFSEEDASWLEWPLEESEVL
jgi:hypothetical protein